jgi:hypothetical protein
MSTRKILYIVAGLLVAGLLLAGISAAATYADNGQGAAGSKVLDRVAQILNIDKTALANAFKQASTEMRQQNTDNMFAKWVADGKLTQAQADQYKAWLAAKPAGVPFWGISTNGTQNLDNALKDGKITQDQYNAIKAWLAQKPNVELPKPDRTARPHSSKAPAQ